MSDVFGCIVYCFRSKGIVSCLKILLNLTGCRQSLPPRISLSSFYPFTRLRRLSMKKQIRGLTTVEMYSNHHWFQLCIALFLNKGLGWNVSVSFSLEYKGFPNKELKRQCLDSAWGNILAYCLPFL